MSEETQEKNVGGRPRIDFDEKTFYGLLRLQCTQEEIAGFFDCDVDTIRRYALSLDSELGFTGLLKKYGSEGKISLRRAQYKNAVENMNTTMQVWLGKNWLGQTDKSEILLPKASIELKYSVDDDAE